MRLFPQRKSRVHMLVSVDEYQAGRSFRIPAKTADRFIARGYSEGEFSREYSVEELDELKSNPLSQVISV